MAEKEVPNLLLCMPAVRILGMHSYLTHTLPYLTYISASGFNFLSHMFDAPSSLFSLTLKARYLPNINIATFSQITKYALRSNLPVKVVDRVAPMVLVMPAETRETHANIQPRDLQKIRIESKHLHTAANTAYFYALCYL